MDAASQIAVRHFGRKAVADLARQGVRVTGLQALPGPSGGFLDAETGYVIDARGTSRVLTYACVRGMIAETVWEQDW